MWVAAVGYFTDGANPSTKGFCFQVPCHLTGVDGPADSTMCKLVTILYEFQGTRHHYCPKGEECLDGGWGLQPGGAQLFCAVHLSWSESMALFYLFHR